MRNVKPGRGSGMERLEARQFLSGPPTKFEVPVGGIWAITAYADGIPAVGVTGRLCRKALSVVVGSFVSVLLCVPAAAVVSSNGGSNPPYTGININTFVGADTFYNHGYTGSRAIVTNIEAGHIWNQHETLTHVTTFIDSPNVVPPNGDFDRHATWVGGVLGGRSGAGPNAGDWQRGIAYGAELWSGSLATSWRGTPFTQSFNESLESIRYPYHSAMVAGVGGRTTDVVNSSFSGGVIRDNSRREARIIDAFANQTGKTVVFVAGNLGNTANPQPGAFATTFNSITVGGLTSDTSSPPYGSRTPASSYGPNNFWNPATQTIVPGVVSTVDIVAPGTNITLPLYGGTTGGNTGGTLQAGTNLYSANGGGTSFAAPQVAGGAALLVDAGKAVFGGGPAVDGRVIKSVLQNSAMKTAGWDNGQILVDGVLTTTRSLDYRLGAGRMNLDRAYTQYAAGTTDVPGLSGGSVKPVGWDFGEVADVTPSDYVLSLPMRRGRALTATLNWFMDNAYDYASDTLVDQSLDNLDLEVWKVTPGSGVPEVLVARSNSVYNNVEHVTFPLSETAYYVLRVRWSGEVFDTVNDQNTELFGLAWSGTAALLGDADDNGIVNHDDFRRLYDAFGRAGTFEDGDFNLNGVVEFADFQILERNFGLTISGTIDASVGQAPSIPEPAAAGTVVLAMALLARVRRKPTA